ncbi:amino acid adenylation domain-containing protein [Paenibacillus barcinonensis]|uniref:non-ribosomal peptide synthetase n=1 Tax=Paenibacillus barcinonensis TaxID=198119 RepID=UPI001C11E72C|nr:amino acid adenylation domain-containing protein [Paenibacillus barcinonensis]
MFNQLEKSMIVHSDRFEEMKIFWQNELACIDRSVQNMEIGTAAKAAVLNLSLSDEINHMLHTLGKNDPLLMYILLLSGLQITASYFWDVQKMVTISPALQQLKMDTTFGNMIPLHVEVEKMTTFSDHVKKTRDKLLNCYEHQDYPVEELWEAGDIVPTGTEQIIFCANFRGLHSSFDEISMLQEYPKFFFSEEESHIEVEIHYNSAMYKPYVMDSFLICYSNALEQLLSSPKMSIENIQFIHPEQLLKLKKQSSPNNLPVTTLKSNLVKLLKESVGMSPHRIAVWSHHGELTFMELDKRTDQVASQLFKSGAVKGEIIGLEVDRSEQTVAAIFGILKAGCAYLPLDPTWPELRVKEIINNAGISKIIVTSRSIQGIESIEVIDLNQTLAPTDMTSFPEIHPNDLAYVIYTSGSTGKPKGTMIEHRNVINLIEGLKTEGIYHIPGQRVACVAPFYFDASVQQIFSSLLLGHSLYIVPEHTRLDGEALLDFFINHQIHISDGTPMHLRMLTVAAEQQKHKKIMLSQMMIGGEALPYKVVQDFTEAFSEEAPLVINVYGPTECCVDTTVHRISPQEMTSTSSTVPIGKPLMNQSVYILDNNLELRPEGAPGNLYVAGLNVGRGYLQLQELTQERFIHHPDMEGEVLYKTGDLARWVPDGVIEFLGRADFQMKYNGYRIEPGDIEQAVLKYEHVTAALVKVVNLNEVQQRLTLYYTSRDDVSYEKLKNHLSSLLPSYMLPQTMIHLDEFPLLPNGKIAMNRLPIPEFKTRDNIASDEPENHVEQQISDAWTVVLGRQSPNMNLSFFEWGGDSLKALQLKLELEKRDIQLKLHDIFQYQTIRRLSQKWMDLNRERNETKRKTELFLPELLQRFKLQLEKKCLYIEGHHKQMWIVQDGDEGQVESMLSFVKKNYVKEVYPHYVVRSQNQIQWEYSTFRANLEKETLEILNEMMRQNDQLSMEITQNPVIERFNISPMQRAFLGISNSYSGVVLTADTLLEKADILYEMECIIKNEVLLHSSLTPINDTFEWNEHKITSHLSIPYADLRLFTPEEQSYMMRILNSRLFYEKYALTGGQLFRIGVLRMNEREYQIILACHHAIYDEMSGDYIQKVLSERLDFKEAERKYPNERKLHYKEYVEQILKGPVVPEQQIIDTFSLDHYDKTSKKIKKWLDQHTDGVLRKYRIEVPLVPYERENSSEFFFDRSLYLIQSCCNRWLGGHGDDIPLLLFNYGRRSEHYSYYNMFGVFIDILPYVLSEDVQNYNREIRQLLKTVSEQNINFAAFLYEKNETYPSENIARMIAPSDHSGIWFNYHGKIDDDKLDGLKMSAPLEHETEIHHANQIFGTASMSFDVSYTNECYRLSLTVPFDINVEDMENEIHNLIHEQSYMSTGAL